MISEMLFHRFSLFSRHFPLSEYSETIPDGCVTKSGKGKKEISFFPLL